MTDRALGITPTFTPMPGGSLASGSLANVTDNDDTTYIEIDGSITSGLQYQAFAFDLGSAVAVSQVIVKCQDGQLDGDQFSAEAWRWWRVRVSDDGSTWADLATGLLNIPLVGWDNTGQTGGNIHQGGYTDPLPAASHRYWEYSFGKNHGLQGYGALFINTISLVDPAELSVGIGGQAIIV